MKITRLIIFLLAFSTTLLGQSVDDMNKKELKENLVECYSKNDSLLNVSRNLSKANTDLQDLNISLQSDLTTTKNILIDSEKSISSLRRDLVFKSDSIQFLSLRINDQDRKILKLTDSLGFVWKRVLESEEQIEVKQPVEEVEEVSDSAPAYKNPGANSNDFLNRYFATMEPIGNRMFVFSLEKIIVGEISYGSNNYYDSYSNRYEFAIPEIIDAKEFTYHKVNMGITLKSVTKIKDALIKMNLSEISKLMPRIELLKNKLLTLNYEDGTQEDFLFNAIDGTKNNQRKSIQINLASEEVRSDNTKNNERDIIWKIMAIGNECYLALGARQLERIKVAFSKIEDGIKFSGSGYGEIYIGENRHSYTSDKYKNYIPSRSGFYIFRNKDAFMDNSYGMDPNQMILLFKLIPM
jgi:hypothetical protein